MSCEAPPECWTLRRMARLCPPTRRFHAACSGWVYCLYKAWTGNGARFEIPVIGSIVTPNAEMLASRVNT